jgi:hypothetical protein
MLSTVRNTMLTIGVGMGAFCARPALANSADSTTVTPSCSGYTITFNEPGLTAGAAYTVDYAMTLTPATAGTGKTLTVNGAPVTFVAPTDGVYSTTVSAPWGPLKASYTFAGTETLSEDGAVMWSGPITFTPPSVTCTACPPHQPCSEKTAIDADFNGKALKGGDTIWFNANFAALGIPRDGATISMVDAAISFESDGTAYRLMVPNGKVVFSATAVMSSTTFDSQTNTWTTTVPARGDDEIFLTGMGFPVPAGGLPGHIGPVRWEGTLTSEGTPGVLLGWRFGAAVYTQFTTNYNQLAVKPVHQLLCGAQNSDHAGTPEGVTDANVPWKKFVTAGAMGDGDDNWTGGWSYVQPVLILCRRDSE